MTGTLFVVATPIGNLEDITLRALRILREAAVIAAEDTRRTRQLLRHYDITTPIISAHAHNERHRVAHVLSRLRNGESVALVSDAGTPGISDPGAIIVRAAREAGLRVDPIPGPSAVTTLLSASGLSFERFAFAGFVPVRGKARNSWFAWVKLLSDIPVVCFEAPHRIERTLAELHLFLVNRPILLARELTKLHEEWQTPTSAPPTSVPPAAVLPPTFVPAAADSARLPRGEFTFVIAPRLGTEVEPRLGTEVDRRAPTDGDIRVVFGQITESQTIRTRKDAARVVAEQLGLSANAVYEALERVKNSPET